MKKDLEKMLEQIGMFIDAGEESYTLRSELLTHDVSLDSLRELEMALVKTYKHINQKEKDLKYLTEPVNYTERIANASSEGERKVWQRAEISACNYGFTFRDGWVVEAFKQKCGHWEILQHPVRPNETIAEVLDALMEQSSQRNCTHCICNFKF